MPDPLDYTPLFVPDEEEPKKKKGILRVVADTGRATVGKLGPTAARVVGGVASTTGGPWGAGFAGAGETAAQMLENKSMDTKKLDSAKIAVEAGLGLIPASNTIKAGKFLASAGLNALQSGAGVLARKGVDIYRGKDPDWSIYDLLPVGLGGVAGGLAGKMTPAVAGAAQGASRTSPEAVEEAIAKSYMKDAPTPKAGSILGISDADDAVADAAPRLRAKRAGSTPDGKPIMDPAPSVVKDGENAGKMTGVGLQLRTTDPQVPAVTDAISKTSRSQDKVNAITDLDNAIEVGQETAKARRSVNDKLGKAAEKRHEASSTQEAKNLNAREKKLAELKAKRLVKQRLKGMGEKEETTTVTDVVQTTTPSGRKVTATKRIRPAQEEDGDLGGGGGGASKQPVSSAEGILQIPGNYHIVGPDGKVLLSLKSEQETMEAINQLGPKYKVLPPEAPVTKVPPAGGVGEAAPTKAQPFNPPKMTEVKGSTVAEPLAESTDVIKKASSIKGTPGEVLDDLTAGTGKPAIPPVEIKQTPAQQLAAKRKAARDARKPAKQPIEEAGSKITATDPAAANVAAKAEAAAQPPAFKDPTAVTSGAKLERRLQEGTSPTGVERRGAPVVAADTQFARFLRGPSQAAAADKFNQEIGADNPEAARALNQLWAQYEVAKGPAKKALGAKIQAVRKGFGIQAPPKVAKGAQNASQTPPAAPGAAKTPQAWPDPSPEVLARADAFNVRRQAILDDPNIDDATRAKLIPELDKEADALQIELLKRTGPEKGTTIGAGLGGLQDIFEMAGRNPEFASNLIGGAGGAAIGATTNEDDPLLGAMVGGAAGTLGMKGLRSAASGSGVDLSKLGRIAPNFQRANLLAGPNLGINTVGAPLGSGIMGGIERMLTGGFERIIPGEVKSGALEEGAGIIKNMNPFSLVKRVPQAWDDAVNRLHGINERGEQLIGDVPTIPEKVIALPATMMATGDNTVRNAIKDAGASDNIARTMTVTSNPRYQFGESLANLAKQGGLTVQLLQPFVRTGINVMESGIERTPLIGLIARMSAEPGVKATISEIAARQGQGAAVAYISYQIGKSVDPATAKDQRIPVYISNMSGQFGLVAGAAFAAGQAAQRGKEGPEQFMAAAGNALRDTPLPETRLAEDNIKGLVNLMFGKPVDPNAEGWPQKWLPKGALPGMLRDDTIDDIGEIVPTYKGLFKP